MDEKDEAILRIISRRSGLSSRKLSNMLNFPIPTVHRRIKNMEKEGVITGYKALVNFENTKWPIGALLLIDLEEAIPEKGPIPKKDILRSLRSFEEIEEIVEVQASNFDLMVRARFETLKKLADFIEKLRYVEGIEETSTAIITEETVLPPQPRIV